jgi:hypothetical protein
VPGEWVALVLEVEDEVAVVVVVEAGLQIVADSGKQVEERGEM